ncbi:hemophore-related protein [Mycobacterium paraterrae]|uniref:Heme-binding protein n=1 Tax=Mycobacterium paraterrae TaxID=577492 RepID=A0ABY3VIZ7_9MYCO|nr:hemophore-related protein [Mycobacterium paraterrae]UMB69384.1 heme-binding protein [Mycobacterium paraterrae]
MSLAEFLSRRAVVSTVAVAALLSSAGQAAADPSPRPPNCSAADVAGVAAGVASALTTYLYTHPDVNGFYTGLQDQPKDQIGGQVQDYFSANPQEEADLEAIRQPMKDIRERCHWTPLLGQGAA